jgi:hypothetical protein
MPSHQTSSQDDLAYLLSKITIVTVPWPDIFIFPWIPFKESSQSLYREMGARASVRYLAELAIINSLAILIGLMVIIGDNPYIALRYILFYPPFVVAFVYLSFVSFLVYTAVHFVCFRLVSGKGNLIAHGYMSALSSTSYILLLWLTLITLLVTRIKNIDTAILLFGGLYLLYPSLSSLQAIHKVSVGRFIGGFVLSVITSIPIYVLYLFLFALIREIRSHTVNNWLFIALFSSSLFVTTFILAYMGQQQRLMGSYPEVVPIRKPIEQMLKEKRVQLVLAALLVSSIVFYLLYFLA